MQARKNPELQERSMISTRETQMAKELDATYKQINQYRKEIQMVKHKLESVHKQDKYF